MKKLQSLESFKVSGLSQKMMSKISGGANEPDTAAGCKEISTNASSTGYVTYTSDSPDGTTLHGIVDVKNCDNPN